MDSNNPDPSNFRRMLLDSPNQIAVGFDLAKDIRPEGNFKSIEISGMGGSALPGNLIRVYLSDLFKRKSDGRKRIEVFQIMHMEVNLFSDLFSSSHFLPRQIVGK